MSFTPEQIQKALDGKVSRLTAEDIARVAAAAPLVRQKIAEFPESLSASRARAELLLAFAVEGQDELAALKLAAGALLYLTSPLDLVPDHEPGGFADDAAVVDLAASRLHSDLLAFCARTGRTPTP